MPLYLPRALSRLKATSSAASGVPSWNRTPSRRAELPHPWSDQAPRGGELRLELELVADPHEPLVDVAHHAECRLVDERVRVPGRLRLTAREAQDGIGAGRDSPQADKRGCGAGEEGAPGRR